MQQQIDERNQQTQRILEILQAISAAQDQAIGAFTR